MGWNWALARVGSTSPQGVSAPAAMSSTATRRAACWRERSRINWLKSRCGSDCALGVSSDACCMPRDKALTAADTRSTCCCMRSSSC
eukprot:scaffold8288_cov57-Attheya_sp.AAC.2